MITSAGGRSSAVVAAYAHRWRGRLIAATCALLGFGALSALAATPAFSLTTHLYDQSTSMNFGSTSEALGVAVDQSDGSVYVGELGAGAVRKFNAAGEPDLSFGGGTGAISVASGPWQLAVDSSSHDFYVSDDNHAVYKFDSEGNPVSSFGTSGHVHVNVPIGIAVDPANGDLYAASYQDNEVDVFSSSGQQLSEFSTDEVTAPLAITVDSSGSVYVAGGGSGFGGSGGLGRYSASGTPEGVVQEGSFQGLAVDPATQDIYASRSEEITQYTPGAETVISTIGAGVILDDWGVGVDEKTGEVYSASYADGRVDAFGPLITIADVTTDPPVQTEVGHTGATLTGQVDPDGGSAVIGCEIEYGVDTSYSTGRAPCDTTTPFHTPTEVEAHISGLMPVTTYHYRFVVKNESGTSYGQDQTLETKAVIGLETGSATNVGAAEASLGGAFLIDAEGGDTHYYFEYGPDVNYGRTTSGIDAGSQIGVSSISEPIVGLDPFSVYHYRIVASNSYGTTIGADRTFVTKAPDLPVVESTISSDLLPTQATLEARINPGLGSTTYRFQYGTTESYGLRTYPNALPASDSVQAAATQVSGLSPGTTYHFRVIAVNFAGTTVGPDQIFNTPAPPVVGPGSGSAASQTSASMTATVIPGYKPTIFHFEFGRTTAYGSATPESAPLAADDSEHAVAATVSNLASATVYHYRLVASNAFGVSDGPDQTLTTLASPVLVVSPASAKCKGPLVKRHQKCVRKKRHKQGRKHG